MCRTPTTTRPGPVGPGRGEGRGGFPQVRRVGLPQCPPPEPGDVRPIHDAVHRVGQQLRPVASARGRLAPRQQDQRETGVATQPGQVGYGPLGHGREDVRRGDRLVDLISRPADRLVAMLDLITAIAVSPAKQTRRTLDRAGRHTPGLRRPTGTIGHGCTRAPAGAPGEPPLVVRCSL
jgi:hypothetical protein